MCGKYTGEAKELESDFLFSTNVSMCRSLELFDKREFDYIIIDECHHAVAETYRKIIDYFELLLSAKIFGRVLETFFSRTADVLEV